MDTYETSQMADARAALFKAVADWERTLRELRERVGLGGEESPGVAD